MKISKLTSKQAHAQKLIYDIFTNNGVVGVETEDRDKLSLQFDFNDVFKIDSVMKTEGLDEFKDVFFTEDLTRFIGTTVTSIVQEAVEPELLVVPNLFKSIAFNTLKHTISLIRFDDYNFRYSFKIFCNTSNYTSSHTTNTSL